MYKCIERIIWKWGVLSLCYSLGGQCNCLSAIVFARGMWRDLWPFRTPPRSNIHGFLTTTDSWHRLELPASEVTTQHGQDPWTTYSHFVIRDDLLCFHCPLKLGPSLSCPSPLINTRQNKLNLRLLVRPISGSVEVGRAVHFSFSIFQPIFPSLSKPSGNQY